MTGDVIPFPGRDGQDVCRTAQQTPASPTPVPDLPEVFTPAWQAEHLPLVAQAMGLLHADEPELRRRCQAMAGRSGRTLVADLAAKIDDLGSRIGDVAIALALAALRIRRTLKELPA